jgi:hypothetical protein
MAFDHSTNGPGKHQSSEIIFKMDRNIRALADLLRSIPKPGEVMFVFA